MPALALNDRTVMILDGAEAGHFLHNLITANIETLVDGKAQPAALLSPQGKILFDFLISPAPSGGYQLDIRTSIADDFIKRLTLYKLRAKVTFDKCTDLPVIAGWNSPAPNGAIADGRFPETADVWRLYGDGAQQNAERPVWDRLRIEHGVAESGQDFALGDVFPHDILMDQNHGVDFRKGCYVGQEVVSRMHHRGTARKRVAIVNATTGLPDSGTSILAGEKPVGTLGTVTGHQAMAIVRTDRVANAMTADLPLTTGSLEITMALPEWTGLTFKPGDDTAMGT